MNRLAAGLAVALGLYLYLRSPIDLVPDRLGAVGLVDDLAALVIGLWWFWRRLPAPRPGRRGGASSSRSVGGEDDAGRRLDPYVVLGVARGASREEIRRAYHEQLRQYHPDRVDGLGDDLQKLAHRRTLDIRRAYDELKGR